MAIINGRVPEPDPRFNNMARTVVVKLKEEVARPAPADRVAPYAESAIGEPWTDLRAQFPGLTIRPYFEAEDDVQAFGVNAERVMASGSIEATRYLAVDCPADVNPLHVASRLRESPVVQVAYPEGGPTPPPVNPSDDLRSGNQGYLDPAPGGIDARWAWINGPADGGGARIVDLEQGWTLDHEDLTGAGVTIISGASTAYHGHGTAVLGEIIAVDNTLGGIGIAPAASARVVSQFRDNGAYRTADAIRSAASAMAAGDVLLLEAQIDYPTAAGLVPVEVEELVFDAIVAAVALGIIVVEAAANGGVDLDLFQDVNGNYVLNRNSADFRDSGAIVVGAATSAVPHRRLHFSNHGSRVDCYAWGENIDTSGDGWTGTATNAYTQGFGGTSGASPMVAGAALILQSWRRRQGRTPYLPPDMRRLLTDGAPNTESADPASDRLGVMPNLRAIIEQERSVMPPNVPTGVRIVR